MSDKTESTTNLQSTREHRRAEFNLSLTEPNAPQNYSFEDYELDNLYGAVETISELNEELEEKNKQLEQRAEILFAAHTLIEIGMRALIDINKQLSEENTRLRAFASTSPEAH